MSEIVYGVTSEVQNRQVIPLLVDATGAVIVSQPIGNYGWVSAAWQKDPLRLGYSGTIRGAFSNTNLPAGTSVINGTTVPAGEIWLIDNIRVAFAGVSTTLILTCILISSATIYVLYGQVNAVNLVTYDRQGRWILAPGDNIRLQINNATAGDDAYLDYTGMRIDIDQ